MVGYPFSKGPSKFELRKEEEKKLKLALEREELDGKWERSQLIQCFECPKECFDYFIMSEKAKAELLLNKAKLKEKLKCKPPEGPQPKAPPRYGVFSKKTLRNN